MLHHMKCNIEEMRAARARLQLLNRMAAGMKNWTGRHAGNRRKKAARAKPGKKKTARPANDTKETVS